MQIIVVKLTLYVTEKCRKKEKFTVLFPGKTALKLTNTPKDQTISILYLLQANRPLPYYYWPVIAVVKQCTDGMATV